ncbi:MAG: hypothetical protein QOJ84_1916 [Bradyrhizobium sp.]|jgi:heme A synthase|nr:hypothetical protein [Bradyrhizobium sp.]
MKSLTVKSLLLAGAWTCAATTACVAQMVSGYWVVGNGAIHTCEIVTSNPVIDYNVNSFGTGPYQSLDDARLARSTIGVCPKEDPVSARYRVPEEGAADDPG